MASVEEDDEVISEIDVFISKKLADNLFLFHYPTKHVSMTNENAECLSAKVKPLQQKVELEFSLDVDSKNYDKSRGEQLAINVDGLNPDGDTCFQNNLMDRYSLVGMKAGTSVEQYAVGYLQKDQLHITPLHGIVEVKPGFKFMDKIDNTSKKNQDSEKGKEQEEEPAVAVTVRFENPNPEQANKWRERSYVYQQRKLASEPWINVNYHPYGSQKSKIEYENLTCSQMYKDLTDFSVSPDDYRNELVPNCLKLSGYEISKGESFSSLKSQPLSDQIKHLLINGHVLKFSTIVKKLPSDVDISSVERLVQLNAVLVQGCWVVKSELLYGDDFVSPFTGVKGKTLITARDYVVWFFTKSRIITRKEVLSAIYVPDADLKTMISQIAVKTDHGWEFKYECDTQFLESHRSIEQSQQMKWDYRYNSLLKELNLGMQDGNIQKLTSPVLPRPKQKRQSRSSLSEEGEESGTDSSTGHKDSKSKRVYSPKKKTVSSPTKHSSKTKPFHIATLDVSPTFLESSPSDDVKAELKDFVEETMRTQFIMTLSELKESISDTNLSALINRSDFESIIEEALQSCGAQKLKNKWPQNTTPEPLYAFTEFGTKLDRYRNILLEVFSTTARARMNLFVKSVEDELREIISENDCRQIFEEYCVYKSGCYYLKGTISLDS